LVISGQLLVISGKLLVISGKLLVISGKLLVISGKLLVISGKLLVISGKLLVISGKLLVISGQLLVISGKLKGHTFSFLLKIMMLLLVLTIPADYCIPRHCVLCLVLYIIGRYSPTHSINNLITCLLAYRENCILFQLKT